MGKYDIQKIDIPIVKLDDCDILSQEEKIDRERKHKILRELGVYVSMYFDTAIEIPEHIDGIHNYIEDANLAEKIVMSGEEIPDDLKERLLYYKSLNWLDKE